MKLTLKGRRSKPKKNALLRPVNGGLLRNRKLITLAGILAVLLVVVVLSLSAPTRFGFIGRWINALAEPVERFFARGSSAVDQALDGTGSRRELAIENEQLKARIGQLEQELREMSEYRRENERLTTLLGFKELHPELQTVPARVIARLPSEWFNEFTIDKGANDGITVNSAVVSVQGLLGRVDEVFDSSARVITLIDLRSAVGCLIERSRDNGVVKGTFSASGSQAGCRMYYLPSEPDVQIGDKVITSGLSDIFPKGLLVGEVVELPSASQMRDYAVVRPAADFLHVEEVLVILSEPQADAKR